MHGEGGRLGRNSGRAGVPDPPLVISPRSASREHRDGICRELDGYREIVNNII